MIDYLEDLLEEEPAIDLTEGVPGAENVPPEPLEEGEAALVSGRETEEGPSEALERPSWPRKVPGAGKPPAWMEDLARGEKGVTLLTQGLRRTRQAAGLIHGGRETLTVTIPEPPAPGPTLDLQAIDRAVQRDARRYDGGFTLY